jgi:hypothetical protein
MKKQSKAVKKGGKKKERKIEEVKSDEGLKRCKEERKENRLKRKFLQTVIRQNKNKEIRET